MSSLFTDEELTNLDINDNDNTIVTVLGKSFANDNERREYFREELRKKLPELKKLEGYPIGEDDDIVNLSDPPYYTACPNPWLNDFVTEWEKEKESPELKKLRKDDFEVKDPYASDVSEGKNNPVYMAHMYHTKVPYPAIMRYLLHYTQPGDIVLDGFSGTGMTGVAANTCGRADLNLQIKIEEEFKNNDLKKMTWGKRHCILGDLSPIATYIAYNYNSKKHIPFYEQIIRNALFEIEKDLGWMYETKHNDGTIGKINYVIWSDVFICPDCGSNIIFYNSAVDKVKGIVKDEFPCPGCGALHSKDDSKRKQYTIYDKFINQTRTLSKTVPVLINYTAANGKRYEKEPDNFDYEQIKKIEEYKINTFIPKDVLPEGFNTQQPKQSHKYDKVYDFFTLRNLIILSKLYEKLDYFSYIAITSILFNASKLYRWRTNGKGGCLNGTLYIASTVQENNVFKIVEAKTLDLKKALLSDDYNIITTGSSSHYELTNNSIDYIFTDPPFGSNIMYSELNILWESWLKVKTNNKQEAIENDIQNKELLDYESLMQLCFNEYYRILKPGHWITIEFSNTSASVWNSIQLALNRVGFVIANVSSLDKKQGSFKAVTTPTAVKQDLVISCYKPSETFTKQFMIQDSRANTWSFISEHLEHLPIPSVKDERTTSVIERSPKVLYDRLITYFFMRGLPVPLDAADFQEGLRNRYIQEDGMIFTSAQLNQYHELKKKHNITDQPSLFVDIIESENDAIQWIKEKLEAGPLKYQDIQPEYRKAYTINRKGEIEVELKDVLEENFIQESDGSWRIPDMNEQKDRDALRTKALLKIWEDYCAQVESGKVKKLKDVRLEAVKAGFKDSYQKKDYKRIVAIGDKVPENLLTEDETLLNYYDIATNKV